MRRRLERHERLIHRGSAHRHPALAPVAGVSRDRVDEAVMAEVVAALVRVASVRARRVQQRQAHRVVGRLVPAVLAVVDDADAECPAQVVDVRPLLRRHFVLVRLVVRALDRAEAEVVNRLRIRRGERERRLELGVRRAPVDEILDLDAIAAFGQPDALDERRAGGLARDLERRRGRGRARGS